MERKMKLTEILPLEKWVEIEEEIHERSGLASSIFNTDGIKITDNKKWVNRLCPVVKADKKGQTFICAVANMNITEQAKRSRKPVVEECDAGLVKLVVPIFVKDQFVGTAGGCGLLLDGGEVDGFMLNKTLGLKEEEIAGLSNDIESISVEKAHSVCAYIQERIEGAISKLEGESD
jgi:ligand-binding sensor protein